MEKYAPYAKAIVAIVGVGITTLLGLIAPDTELFTVLTVVSAMITAAGVYLVPNGATIPDGTGKRRLETKPEV